MPEAENYTSVWVHSANVKEVGGQQGFVECTEKIAALLIDRGDAQDPRCGGFDLIEMEDPTASTPRKTKAQTKNTETVVETDKSMTAVTASTAEAPTYQTK